jgi:hypothetical protein
MVIVTQRRSPKLKIARQKEHDFSQGQDHCAKCGMRLNVWEHTHVFCPGKPYAVKANKSLARR